MTGESHVTKLRPLERVFVRAQGPDAARYLQGMLTCDVMKAMKATEERGQPSGGRSYLLDAKGKAITELVLLAVSATEFWLSLPAAQVDAAFQALDRYLVADDLTLERVEKAPYVRVLRSPVSLFNPIPALPPSVPGARDRLSTSVKEAWGLRILRGEFGARDEEWWVTNGSALPAHELFSETEWEARRVESGVVEWGVDLGPDALILEFPLADTVSFHKGCYIGQETVARATYRGKMNRGFTRFMADGALERDFVYAESDLERPVGKITSVAGSRGLGLLRFTATEGGARLVQKTATGLRRLTNFENLNAEGYA